MASLRGLKSQREVPESFSQMSVGIYWYVGPLCSSPINHASTRTGSHKRPLRCLLGVLAALLTTVRIWPAKECFFRR